MRNLFVTCELVLLVVIAILIMREVKGTEAKPDGATVQGNFRVFEMPESCIKPIPPLT